MPAPNKSAERPAPPVGMRDIVLLLWLTCYLLVTVEPHLVYHAHGSTFSLAPEFAGPFFHAVGGPAQYAGRFLCQLCAWNWLGALLLAAEAALLLVLTELTLRSLAGREVRFARYLPLLPFAALAGHYDQPMELAPTVLLMLACVLLVRRLPARPRAVRLFVLFLLSGALYSLSAGAANLNPTLLLAVFALLCSLGDVRAGEPLWSVAAFAAVAPAALLGPRLLPPDPAYAWDPWRQFIKGHDALLTLALLFSLPLAAGGALAAAPFSRAWQRLAARLPRRAAAASAADLLWLGRLAWLLQTASLVWLVSFLAGILGPGAAARRELHLDYAAMNRQWADVLATAGELTGPEITPMVVFDINRALFETGRLADDMFHYPQVSTRMILPMRVQSTLGYMYRISDFWLSVGRPNDAEHVACEALAQFGSNPYVLRQLILATLAKGDIPAARLCLRALSGDLVYGSWARSRLALLERDPLAGSDPEVRAVRSIALARDDVAETVSYPTGSTDGKADQERMLLNLLADHPNNRMAFQYLMGIYLLTGRLDDVVKNINRLDDFGVKEIPRAYEEALAIYIVDSGRKPDLHGRVVKPETIARYWRFREALASAGGQTPAGFQAVAPEYGDTYFYYFALRGGRRR